MFPLFIIKMCAAVQEHFQAPNTVNKYFHWVNSDTVTLKVVGISQYPMIKQVWSLKTNGNEKKGWISRLQLYSVVKMYLTTYCVCKFPFREALFVTVKHQVADADARELQSNDKLVQSHLDHVYLYSVGN